MTKLLPLTLILCLVSFQADAAANCTAKGKEGNYQLLELDGKPFFALNRTQFEGYVQARTNVKKLEAQRDKDSELIKELQQQVEAYKKLATNYKTVGENYQQLEKEYIVITGQYKDSLDASVQLNDKYKENATKLLGLTGDYDKLARDFDELAGKYRDIALGSSSFISFDLGIGATRNNGKTEAAALVGVGIKKFKVWGFLQDQNSGILAGASFDF